MMRVRTVALVASLILVAVACGGDDGETTSSDEAAADATEEPATPEPDEDSELEPQPATEPAEETPSEPEPEPVTDPLALGEGEMVTFEVEVVVTESPTEAFTVGDVIWMPNCYTLSADGTFDDPGFPSAEAPILGTWENGWDGTSSSYTAFADAGGLTLAQTGSVTSDEATGELQLTADTVVSAGDSMLVRLTSTGSAVGSCTPVAG